MSPLRRYILSRSWPRRVAREPRDADVAVGVVVERAQAQDVGGAFLGRAARAIGVGERADVGQREAGRARRSGRAISSASTAGAQPRTISTTAASSASASGGGAFSSIYWV